MNQNELLESLIAFAADTHVNWSGDVRSWRDHTVERKGGRGFVDEDILVRPAVFPKFAQQFLGFTVGFDLVAETNSTGGRPDFAPSDKVAYPFVFECKGSDDALDLRKHRSQITRYLSVPPIRQVVLINMVKAVVFEIVDGEVKATSTTDFRGLYREDFAAVTGMTNDVKRFTEFVAAFKAKDLTTADKIETIRNAPAWTNLNVTDADWVTGTIDGVVQVALGDVLSQIRSGALLNPVTVSSDRQQLITADLRTLAARLEASDEELGAADLRAFLDAAPNSPPGKALSQYASQVAYWLVTKMLLIRIWEDAGIINPPALFDGGFDEQMIDQKESVLNVLGVAMTSGSNQYPAMFTERPTLAWYKPTETTAVDILYKLASAYLGNIQSDILGQVYERTHFRHLSPRPSCGTVTIQVRS